MRLLITGGAGYLGGRLANFFSNRDVDVRVASSKFTSIHRISNVENVGLNWESELSIMNALENVDVILHTVGMNAADCYEDIEKAFYVNSIYTARLIKCSIAANVRRIIYFSTAHVYKSPLTGIISEEFCPQSLHPYATSHRAAEDIILSEVQRGRIEGIVIRLSNSFGAPNNKEVNCWMLFVNDICRQAVVENKITIRGDASQRRDFIPLTVVCLAIEHIVNLPIIGFEKNIFNLGSGKSLTLLQMARKVSDRMRLFNKYVEIEVLSTVDFSLDLVYQTNRLNKTGFSVDIDKSTNEEIDILLQFCNNAFVK